MIEVTPIRNGENVQSTIIIMTAPVPSYPKFSEIIPCYLTDIHTRLWSIPPARIADIGCGDGGSIIDMAVAYPRVRIDGYDIDEAAIERAWAYVRRAGVTDRVTFHVRDVTDDTLNGRYDLVISSMPLQGMDRSVDVLKAMRRLVMRNGNAILLIKQIGIEDLSHYATEAGFSRADILPTDSAAR